MATTHSEHTHGHRQGSTSIIMDPPWGSDTHPRVHLDFTLKGTTVFREGDDICFLLENGDMWHISDFSFFDVSLQSRLDDIRPGFAGSSSTNNYPVQVVLNQSMYVSDNWNADCLRVTFDEFLVTTIHDPNQVISPDYSYLFFVSVEGPHTGFETFVLDRPVSESDPFMIEIPVDNSFVSNPDEYVISIFIEGPEPF